MEEWKTYKLKDLILKVIDNRGKSAPVSTDMYQPLIEINALGGYSPYYSQVKKYVSKETYDNWFRSGHPQIGDILIPTVGTIGIVSIMTENKGCIAQNVIGLRVKDFVCPEYIFYFLKSERVKKEMINLNIGGVQPSIKVPHLMNMDIVLPPLEKQYQIAYILRSLDEKIELNNRINHNLEEQAQALFDDWCSTCHEKKTIGELAANILDYSKNTCSKVILVNSSDITEGKFESLPYSENENLKGQFKKRFQKGDILFSEIRPRNKHYALCYFNADEYIASTRLIVLRHNANLIGSSTLLYQYIKSCSVQEGFIAKTESRSGTFPQGNYADLASEEVPYSEDNKQLTDLLDGVYKQIWSNLKENDNLVKQRDELLPRLMSGELTC